MNEPGCKDNRTFLSVIIPAWNEESRIASSVRSVHEAVLDGCEIIVVDDGSSDQTFSVCQSLSNEIPELIVVHRENGGLSAARNTGLDAAKGDYIFFLDADDRMDPKQIHHIISAVQKHQPDLLCFGWHYISQNGEVSDNRITDREKVLSADEIRQTIVPQLVSASPRTAEYVGEFACNKVYRRQFLEENQIRFLNSRRIWEDLPFVSAAASKAQKAVIVPELGFYYIGRPGSLSSQFTEDIFKIIAENFRIYQEITGGFCDLNGEYARRYWHGSIDGNIRKSILHYKDHPDGESKSKALLSHAFSDPLIQELYFRYQPETRQEQRRMELVRTQNWSQLIEQVLSEENKQKRKESAARLRGRLRRGLKKISKGKQLIHSGDAEHE